MKNKCQSVVVAAHRPGTFFCLYKLGLFGEFDVYRMGLLCYYRDVCRYVFLAGISLNYKTTRKIIRMKKLGLL